MRDSDGKRYLQQTFFTGRLGMRRTWYGRKVVRIEEKHRVLQGYLPSLLSTGAPGRSVGDEWTTWRDSTPQDFYTMALQIQLRNGYDT